jgi:ADP-heptose:LPS heptosyltransferase
MCTPAVRAFKNRFPECRLDFLTEHPDVLRGNPRIDDIILVDPANQLHPLYQYRLIKKIRKMKYDLIVDFLANPRTAYYSFLSGAATRLSYGYGHRRWAYNTLPAKPDKPVYAALDRLNLLKSIEVSSDDPNLEFYPSDEDRARARELLRRVSGKRIVTVSPVSRRAYRRWPLERFTEICRLLKAEHGFEIVILVGPGEETFGETLRGMLNDEEPLFPRIESLGLLGAIFENSSLHIGNDNGPKHIAVACGAPTFAVFGADNHISWTFPDSNRHYYITSAELNPECRAENHKCGPECLNKITVTAFYEALSKLIAVLPEANRALEQK